MYRRLLTVSGHLTFVTTVCYSVRRIRSCRDSRRPIPSYRGTPATKGTCFSISESVKMGVGGALASGLTDQFNSFVDPLVKLNKRQALTQGVNLGGATTYCINDAMKP